MKRSILVLSFFAFLAIMLTSCKKEDFMKAPILYVVNSTDYRANVYCDNLLVASVKAKNNSGKIILEDTSVNLPVYIEVDFLDSKGKTIHNISWDNYYFSWNKSYKMTLKNTTSTLRVLD